ncbi:MAG TPA: carboxypeptidase regulatory-like domain-containing protein [Candidatus Sulfotelmatobacter sp.]|nr:carboxypeptidase regulatory-like domain-containing protein [Candidatus Sulfotelmatobacter sp.]
MKRNHLSLIVTLSFRFAPALALTALLLLAGTPAAYSQVDRAELEGTVSDPSGSVIVGADVKVVAVDTGLSEQQHTNSKGYYRFPGLAVGRYAVTVSTAGFKTKLTEDVVLRVGQTRTLDVQLAVGAISEQIEVKASNGPADRSSAEAATVIDTNQISELPNNGRDWASFTLLAPFAQDDGGGDQRTIRFAGRARDDNNFSFDGVDAGGIQEQAQKSQTRLQISQDAIQEYRVNSALYDAEYGTQAGGQIDVVTKSGTNDWHGTAFGYIRNSVFDARNFNDYDLNNKPYVPPFRMGQYGMTLGGPIKKDKLFFFINYEGLRQLQSTTQQFFVPSGFCCGEAPNPNSSGPPAIALPTSFLQNVLTKSPQMCEIMQGFPWRASVGTINGCSPRFTYPDTAFAWQGNPQDFTDPNSNSNADQVTAATPTIVHEDTWLVRVDYKVNNNNLLYGRAQRDISLVDAPNGASLPADKVQTINHPANYLLALEHTFTPNLFNEAKVYVNRSPFHNPQSSALPYSVSTNTFVGLNNNNADIEVGTTYGVVDNLIWTHGRHAFKTGMEVRRVRLNQGKTADNNLSFGDNSGNFETAFTTATLYQINFTAPWCCHKLRRTFYMPYFQDEWKVTPTLTLNLGLRWEYYGVANEADNRTTVFDYGQFHGVCLGSGSTNGPYPTPINTPACPKNPALYNPNYRNFDPRVSVAWAPGMFHGKTVFRTGFGIYHGAAQNDDLNAGLESDRYTAYVHLDPGGSGTALLPAYQQTIPDLSGLSVGIQQQPRALQRHDRRDLYAETWGLTIDHELPANFLASAQYLGSHGVRLFSRGGVNFCITKPDYNGNCTRGLDQYYPDPSGQTPTLDPYGSVDYKSDIGASTYNALGLSLERRFSAGLSFQTRYTWSHSINDGSVGGGESNGPENVNCLPCDKGPSVFDIRQNFVANGVYELPFGAGKRFLNEHGVINTIVGGWSLSSIGLWHTGHPLTISMNIQPSQLPDGNDQTSQRPDIVPGVPVTLPGGLQPGHTLPINPAAFAPPPLDPGGVIQSIITNPDGTFTPVCQLSCGLVSRFGTAPNGIIRALNSWQLDLALLKNTKITERVSTEFGVQVFNIFNHVQLGDPNGGNLTFNYVEQGNTVPGATYVLQQAGNLGQITSTNNFNNNNDNAASPNTGTGLPRQIQFMLRVKF